MYTFSPNTVVESAKINANFIELQDADTALSAIVGTGGAWTTWVPTISASGGGSPAIGNGTFACKYVRIGKIVICRFSITVGTTTSFGTGVVRFSIPVASVSHTKCGVGTAYFEDAGVQAYLGMFELAGSAGGYVEISYASTSASGRSAYISGSIPQPFAWGNGDYITGIYTYEAA